MLKLGAEHESCRQTTTSRDHYTVPCCAQHAALSAWMARLIPKLVLHETHDVSRCYTKQGLGKIARHVLQKGEPCNL